MALRLAFFGTPELAVPTLERLLSSRHAVVAVVSQPDRRRGRGRRRTRSPVAEVAAKRELALLQPERASDPAFAAALRATSPDLGVVVAFGQFLPRRIRELPRLGYCLNAHASLLPRHRGAAPIERAILAGDTRTGVSIMRVEREMDAGPVALERETPIGDQETAGELRVRLGELAADAVADALEQVATNTIEWKAQDSSLATHAPKLERHELAIDWSDSSARIARLVRALAPRPGASTSLRGEPLRVLAARPLPEPEIGGGALPSGEAPGSARWLSRSVLAVATGDGWLRVLRVQRAGGRALPVEEFARGRPISDGERLGDGVSGP